MDDSAILSNIQEALDRDPGPILSEACEQPNSILGNMEALKQQAEAIMGDLQANFTMMTKMDEFFSPTPEMNKVFSSKLNFMEEGALELFETVLRQIKNRIKDISTSFRKDINKLQLPQAQRISLLTQINKDFKQESDKLEGLIVSFGAVKVVRDKLLSAGWKQKVATE